MVALLDSDPLPPCITQHPDFGSVCLRTTVLAVSLCSYRYHYETSDVPIDENRYVNNCICGMLLTISMFA